MSRRAIPHTGTMFEKIARLPMPSTISNKDPGLNQGGSFLSNINPAKIGTNSPNDCPGTKTQEATNGPYPRPSCTKIGIRTTVLIMLIWNTKSLNTAMLKPGLSLK